MSAPSPASAAKDSARQVVVELDSGRDYVIHVGPGLLDDAGALCRSVAPGGGRVVVITQPPVARHYQARLMDAFRDADFAVQSVSFDDGEQHKTLATVERLYQALYDRRADRGTLIVALGGGVVGDVAGFVAATYNRGLPYVQVPTTLLAMVDSSVGGKTGVDFARGKNLIGAFYQPRLVIADTNTLQTLPPREMRSGLAEVVKYGAICDPALLPDLENVLARDTPAATRRLTDVIERSCQIKAHVVAGDEREESGLRAILNFGHTIGHALEAATDYVRYKHGEAIAAGMVSAACIGEAAGITAPQARHALAASVRALDLPVALPNDVGWDDLLSLLSLDKKAHAGRARWVLLRTLGEVAPGAACTLDEDVVRAGLALQASAYGGAAATTELPA